MIPFNQRYIVLDCETRHLNIGPQIEVPNSNRVWQISWIEAQGNRVLSEHDYYIEVPNLNLSQEVVNLTHFDKLKYDKKKIPAIDAFSIFEKFLYNKEYLIIGQNIFNFDVPMFEIFARQAKKRVDYSKFIGRVYDTRALAQAHRSGLEKPRGGDIINWQFKILNDRTLKAKVGQETLLKFFGIEFDPSRLHDGLYDVKMTWEIFKQLRKILEL